MPLVTLTLDGAARKKNRWTHVQTPLTELRDAINGNLDWENMLQYGIRTDRVRSAGACSMGFIRGYNGTAATTAEGQLFCVTSTYVSGGLTYPLFSNARSRSLPGSASSNRYATCICTEAVAAAQLVTAAFVYELRNVDTSGLLPGQNVYLGTTTGDYSFSVPGGTFATQIVGQTGYAPSATDGTILFQLPGTIVPYDAQSKV